MRYRYRTVLAVLVLLTFIPGSLLAGERPADEVAEEILAATGIQGGMVVHLGCGDGRLTAALRATDRYTVHGLEADADRVAAARQAIRKLGLYGPVSVEQFTASSLPYSTLR